MFGRTRLRKKNFKDPGERREKPEDSLEEVLKRGVAGLEELLSEEAKLKQIADEKRREIAKAIGRLEETVSFLKSELGRIRFRFRELFETKETREEKMEIEKGEGGEGGEGLFLEENQLGDVDHGGENIVKSEQEDFALRLQSKEEENKFLKLQIKKMEEEFQIENERREQEVEELRKRLQESSTGQEPL